MNRYVTLALLCFVSVTASSQKLGQYLETDLWIDQPPLEIDMTSSTAGAQWDSLRYVHLGYFPNGAKSSEFLQPSQGSAQSYPWRNTYQYDAFGNTTVVLTEADYNSQGSWTLVGRQEYDFDSLHGLKVGYRWLNWVGNQWDTLQRSRYDYVYDSAGRPAQQSYYIWNGGWVFASVSERYHYSATQQLDTLWTLQYALDSSGYERRVIHSWRDYGLRFPDSVTIHVVPAGSSTYELRSTHRTDYVGNVPQSYRRDQYDSGSLVVRNVMQFNAQGYRTLDSVVSLAGPITVLSRKRNEYLFDSQSRLTQVTYFKSDSSEQPAAYHRNIFVYPTVNVTDGSVSDLSIRIWPNPATEALNVELPAGIQGPVTLQLVDAAGRVRWMQQSSVASHLTRIDVGSGLPQGIYLLRVQSRQGEAVERVVLGR